MRYGFKRIDIMPRGPPGVIVGHHGLRSSYAFDEHHKHKVTHVVVQCSVMCIQYTMHAACTLCAAVVKFE